MSNSEDDERRVVGVLHYDRDSPNVIERPGNVIWVIPDDPDPDAPPPVGMPDGWVDVGYATEDVLSRRHPDTVARSRGWSDPSRLSTSGCPRLRRSEP